MKQYPIIHLIKSGKSWSSVTYCGMRFPRFKLATHDPAEFLGRGEDHTCAKCEAAWRATYELTGGKA